MENLRALIENYNVEINAQHPATAEEKEAFRIKYLGTKGLLKSIMGEMKNVAVENKKEAGQLLNEFKVFVEETFASFAVEEVGNNENPAFELDLTLPGTPAPLGTRHPISIVKNKIVSIFNKLGFSVAEGPEIEDDFHNFSALNLPENHPARDMQDTFYISHPTEPGGTDWLLRTHTSSVQIREMQKGKLPLRIICPGRVFRNETVSARAHCFFNQVEGLYIAENVSFADLKQTLYFFVTEMFGSPEGVGIKVRFRPSYFPFTEPSAEMDISCLICGGEGCSVCKKTGWVEILGCGMVHPKVLENCGIDSNKYTGFAFGMGIERITMLSYQIKDLRLFSENDLRFLKQFESA
ncbi:MAG: phenylalanine--tRNA ligase subunit alpha [Ferruginibacter sp.]